MNNLLDENSDEEADRVMMDAVEDENDTRCHEEKIVSHWEVPSAVRVNPMVQGVQVD